MSRALLLAGLVAVMAPVTAQAQTWTDAQGGVIRWLDKLTGKTGDVELQRGQSASNGRMTLQLDACRYQSDNPAAEAEAHLTVHDGGRNAIIFSGWMIASAPALSAMEHPRYDVWVLRCVIPGYKPLVAEDVPEESFDTSDEDETSVED